MVYVEGFWRDRFCRVAGIWGGIGIVRLLEVLGDGRDCFGMYCCC